MPDFSEPGRATLDDGDFAQHVLPNRADDQAVRDYVARLFTGAGGKPFSPRLLQHVLDHAPDPELLGVADWQRGLRADEVAVIYGEVSPSRNDWLLRADEIARAWGRPLFGPGGLVADVLGPDAPGNLPEPR